MTIDELGKAIRAAREKLGLSQDGVGARAGFGGHVVYNVEKGKQFPCRDRLNALCRAVNISPEPFDEMYKDKDFGSRLMLSRTEFMDLGTDTSETRGRKPEPTVKPAPAADVRQIKKPVAAKPQRVAPVVKSLPRTITQTVTETDIISITVGGYKITINKI